jgi:NIMA (never in mitosis gene a)-related kinase
VSFLLQWAAYGDLRRVIKKAQEACTPFDEGLVWRWFVQICTAVAHMHANRMMHR